jgi:hypothetical protein
MFLTLSANSEQVFSPDSYIFSEFKKISPPCHQKIQKIFQSALDKSELASKYETSLKVRQASMLVFGMFVGAPLQS